MTHARRAALRALTFAALLAALSHARPAAAALVRGLETQSAGGVTYFRVRLAVPERMHVPALTATGTWAEGDLRRLAQLPRLVPQDQHTRAVYLRLDLPRQLPGAIRLAGDGLEFVGKWPNPAGAPSARLLLLYPAGEKLGPAVTGDTNGLAPLPEVPHASWAEAPLRLDLADARPAAAGTDLARLWAEAQAADFAVREAESGAFAFYGFARELTGRKYGVPAPSLVRPPADSIANNGGLLGLTTGAEAIADTLQTRRLLTPGGENQEERTIPVERLPGIPADGHDWDKLLAGKKPAPEPLARWVPADNYYLRFKDFVRFLDFGDLIDRWSTNTTLAFQIHPRDLETRRRYERQLCLRDVPLLRRLGAALILDLATTGSDPYLAEGSDVATIFHVRNRALFLAAIEPFIQEARQDFGPELREEKTEYHGVPVESYVSPLREVSLYRAAVGDVVIHANSPAGLRRILDAGQRRAPALADSPDFRYMRTVFPKGEAAEDGFLFLPEAFIRRVTGPASKIKEKRRAEALTSLHVAANGALFAAWEGAGLPRDQAALLAATGLKPADLDVPRGEGAAWDGRRATAVSKIYNTLRFATPLLEIPIDRVTPAEERDYRQFRTEYLTQWRSVLGPVGVRIRLNDRQAHADVFVLPLAASSRYQELRRWTGGGTVGMDPAALPPGTLVHFQAHLSPELRALITQKEYLGDWCFFRLEDSAVYGELAAARVREGLDPAAAGTFEQQAERLFFRLPLAAGVGVGDPQGFAWTVHSFADLLNLFAGPFATAPLRPPYKGVTIRQTQFDPDSRLGRALNDPGTPRARRFAPSLYHAQAGGAWYISPRAAQVKELIDRAQAPAEGHAMPAEPQGKAPPAPPRPEAPAREADQVHDGLVIAPKAAVRARPGLGLYLEWESHRRALANAPAWYVLFRGGLLPEQLTNRALRDAALRSFGFVPLSPDGAAYAYDPRTDEVVNARHGSWRQPVLHAGIDAASPLGQLLAEFRALRADLRFRADGVQTAVTIERGPR